ncbi:Transcription factor spt20 [Cryptotrichosporon argae]
MASASGYNYHRYARAVLKKARKWEPSLTVELFSTHWRFEGSQMTFTYDGPMKPFLLALRAQVITGALLPFLYDIRPPISFVDGCLVVEIQDHRKAPEVRSRIVMRPAPETLPQTIEAMLERRGDGWDDRLALELESRIIAATSAPLYLGTSPIASRNAVLSLALTAPAGPNLSADGTHRPTVPASDDERGEAEAMRKLLAAGTRAPGSAFQPNWSILRLQERVRARALAREQENAARALAGANGLIGANGANGTNHIPDAEHAQAAQLDKPPEPKKKSKKKRPAEEQEGGEKKKIKVKPPPRDAKDEPDKPSAAQKEVGDKPKPKKKKKVEAPAAA